MQLDKNHLETPRTIQVGEVKNLIAKKLPTKKAHGYHLRTEKTL